MLCGMGKPDTRKVGTGRFLVAVISLFFVGVEGFLVRVAGFLVSVAGFLVGGLREGEGNRGEAARFVGGFRVGVAESATAAKRTITATARKAR